MENITEKEVYEELRPYYDSEIPAAMQRMADSPVLADVVGYAFPGADIEKIRQSLLAVHTADEFQLNFVKQILESIIKQTMTAFTMGGLENLDESEGHLYISDHRDIVLDGSLLQLLLITAGLSTSEITFGSNLISPGFVEDFGRSNKMFKIVRGGSARDLIQNSYILSKHLHDVVNDGRSIWISQRDGRTKNGDDKTDQGLVKMLTMSDNGDDIRSSLKSLNIAPIAISYEYESCDALKTRELYISRREAYVKAPGEDMKSILTGVQQYKGEVHMEACVRISPEEIDNLAGENNNEILRNMASLIDSRIIGGYKLFNTNYMAYDIRNGVDTHKERYTEYELTEFEKYIEKQIGWIEGDKNELTEIMLDIYANPVKNKIELQNL